MGIRYVRTTDLVKVNGRTLRIDIEGLRRVVNGVVINDNIMHVDYRNGMVRRFAGL